VKVFRLLSAPDAVRLRQSFRNSRSARSHAVALGDLYDARTEQSELAAHGLQHDALVPRPHPTQSALPHAQSRGRQPGRSREPPQGERVAHHRSHVAHGDMGLKLSWDLLLAFDGNFHGHEGCSWRGLPGHRTTQTNGSFVRSSAFAPGIPFAPVEGRSKTTPRAELLFGVLAGRHQGQQCFDRQRARASQWVIERAIAAIGAASTVGFLVNVHCG
jgi:hypothetical protein